jgi:hypothetical protein
MIVAQTNEQVDDLVVRLSARFGAERPDAVIGRLSRAGFGAPQRIEGLTNVAVSADAGELAHADGHIATAAKWAHVRERHWRWAIVDEAYQMRSDALLGLASRFDRALFVGDPGQLDPFSTVDSDRGGAGLGPDAERRRGAVAQQPDLPVHRLPVSWRLPVSAEGVVSRAFYPFTGFRSGAAAHERELRFTAPATAGAQTPCSARPPGPGGRCWNCPPGTPSAPTPRRRRRRGAYRRLVERGATARSGSIVRPVTPDRIAVGAAHRDQVAALRTALGELPVDVDTANRLQGREYDVTVFLHPLSGRRDATAFHLEAGRLCVLASRHRQACVVVARAGIRDLLDEHPGSVPVHLNEPVRFPDGLGRQPDDARPPRGAPRQFVGTIAGVAQMSASSCIVNGRSVSTGVRGASPGLFSAIAGGLASGGS